MGIRLRKYIELRVLSLKIPITIWTDWSIVSVGEGEYRRVFAYVNILLVSVRRSMAVLWQENWKAKRATNGCYPYIQYKVDCTTKCSLYGITKLSCKFSTKLFLQNYFGGENYFRINSFYNGKLGFSVINNTVQCCCKGKTQREIYRGKA